MLRNSCRCWGAWCYWCQRWWCWTLAPAMASVNTKLAAPFHPWNEDFFAPENSWMVGRWFTVPKLGPGRVFPGRCYVSSGVYSSINNIIICIILWLILSIIGHNHIHSPPKQKTQIAPLQEAFPKRKRIVVWTSNLEVFSFKEGIWSHFISHLSGQ